jgi:hypothetical protein
VTLEQNGCVVAEHWRGAAPPGKTPYTGTSLTLFDASRAVWHQTYVDNTGLLALFEGQIDAKRDLVLERVTPPGGTSWETTIDLIYHRRSD